MKKRTKIIAMAAAAAVSASLAAVNNSIYNKASKKANKKIKSQNLIYKWKFGNISYRTIGEGKPVLMIHSLLPGTDEMEWGKNIESLSKNNKLYLINLLGYGESERAKIEYSAYLYICLINDFITEVIKQPAAVIASNTSGAIAVMAYIFNKNNFNKICLISPSVFPKKFSFSKRLKNIPADFPIIGDILFNYYNSKSNTEKLLKEEIYSKEEFVTKETINRIYAYSHKGGSNNRHLFSSFISNRFGIGLEASLPETEIPILVIYGESNKDFESDSEKIKELNSSSEIKVIKGKLFPHEEDYKNFNKIISYFIEK